MKKIIFIFSVFFLYLSYGIYLSWFSPSVYETELEPVDAPGYYDYKGITHVHSLRSSGGGSTEEIIEAAHDSNLDFLIFTDLNDFSEAPQIENYDGRLLVMNGGEYSYLDSHILYYGAPSDRPISGIGQAQVVFNDLLSQKSRSVEEGFIVLAHPFKSRYQWTGEYPSGLDGIEILNLMEQWEKSWFENKLSTIWSVLIYPFNPKLSLYRLFQEPLAELELWEKLNHSRHTIGLAGTDATGKALTFTKSFFKFPSYSQLFGLMSNHVLLQSELTGNWQNDRKKILNAIRSGQFYMALDVLADPKGFTAEMSSRGRKFTMGSRISIEEDLVLKVQLPNKPKVPFEVVVLKDGQRYMTSNSQSTAMNIHAPGNYRVVVRLIPTFPLPDGRRWFHWIFTNSFYVRA